MRTTPFTDWLTSATVEVVKIETEAEHLARVNELFEQRKKEMGARYLLHPSNQVQRLDGKTFGAAVPANVRRMKQRIKSEQAA